MRIIVERRVLPAGVYDALAECADIYGGIGAKAYLVEGPIAQIPYCVWGYGQYIERRAEIFGQPVPAIRDALSAALIDTEDNDEAVVRLNRRRWLGLGRFFGTDHARVSFAKWCAELGVERGK